MTDKQSDVLSVDRPDNVTRPPYIYGTAVIMAVIMHMAMPWNIPDRLITAEHGLVTGIGLIALAAIVIMTAFVQFRRAKTTVDSMKPSTAVVTNGIFALSRNPIYLGMTVALVGISLALNSLWILVMAVPVLFVMHFGVIKREEAYLEAKFADSYRAYKQKVRRWL